MTRRLVTLALALSLAGALGACASSGGLSRGKVVTVLSDPSGAMLRMADGSWCETPCDVDLSRQIEFTLTRDGYTPIEGTLRMSDRGKTRRFPMELAAPAVDVEETALPDL